LGICSAVVGRTGPFLCAEGVDFHTMPNGPILATFDTAPSPHGRINAPSLLLAFAHIHGAFYNCISPQPWQCQPNSSSGKSLAKQDPENRSYPKLRKARKRHKKKRPKPSPLSPLVTGALWQQLADHPPMPLTTESAHEHKKRHNQGSPPTPKKAERAQPTETHPPTIHPPYPLTMESFYLWYAEHGCPTRNPDYSWTPTVTKAREKAEATISSESDSDSYYSDCFDSAKAPDPTPTNARMGTPTTQSVHSIEDLRKVEV
jgi:hypothetical protein